MKSGDYERLMTQGEYWNIRKALLGLKRARERQELSLADLSKATGMDPSAISRLENGVQGNPTVSTLARYAKALGKRLQISFVDVPTKKGTIENTKFLPSQFATLLGNRST